MGDKRTPKGSHSQSPDYSTISGTSVFTTENNVDMAEHVHHRMFFRELSREVGFKLEDAHKVNVYK